MGIAGKEETFEGRLQRLVARRVLAALPQEQAAAVRLGAPLCLRVASESHTSVDVFVGKKCLNLGGWYIYAILDALAALGWTYTLDKGAAWAQAMYEHKAYSGEQFSDGD